MIFVQICLNFRELATNPLHSPGTIGEKSKGENIKISEFLCYEISHSFSSGKSEPVEKSLRQVRKK